MTDQRTDDRGDPNGASIPDRLQQWVREAFRSDGSPDAAGTGVDEHPADGGRDAGETDDEEAHGDDTGDEDLLLTNEERVLRELKESGRTEQSELVSRMSWSKVKTSRVLSDMEEAGQVCRIQIGRKKVVSLPDQQFEAAGSPFETDETEPAPAKR